MILPYGLRDPASHDLLPSELAYWFWPALPYMAIVSAIRQRPRPA